jgi:hypothetical protein
MKTILGTYTGDNTNTETSAGEVSYTSKILSSENNCIATTYAGKPCKRQAVLDTDLCCSHLPSLRAISTGPTSEAGIRRSAANLPNLSHWLEELRYG